MGCESHAACWACWVLTPLHMYMVGTWWHQPCQPLGPWCHAIPTHKRVHATWWGLGGTNHGDQHVATHGQWWDMWVWAPCSMLGTVTPTHANPWGHGGMQFQPTKGCLPHGGDLVAPTMMTNMWPTKVSGETHEVWGVSYI
jgi:hypothetical protein